MRLYKVILLSYKRASVLCVHLSSPRGRRRMLAGGQSVGCSKFAVLAYSLASLMCRPCCTTALYTTKLVRCLEPVLPVPRTAGPGRVS